ncbi:MAG: hypothetical protein LBP55_03665 [Candidatus Adiutrix sp.]|jgi:hypothetical protein|nr:hypothetical protein [Candidatus Adiutrix sp.]
MQRNGVERNGVPADCFRREGHSNYYVALAQADKESKATVFVELMLQSLIKSLTIDQVTDQASDQVTDINKSPTQKYKLLKKIIGPRHEL